jgi:DNA (cytosine-5)-methyltransferase 1
MGYHRAFPDAEIVGHDIVPQPHYPFTFMQAEALGALANPVWVRSFDFIHASPPCQAYSVLAQSHRNAGKSYPDLVAPTRELLVASGVPWVIENVVGAPVRADITLCGSMFGMRVRRHRRFECSFRLTTNAPRCDHSERPVVVSGNNHSGGFTAAEIMAAMEMPWAKTRYEVRQAIPPAYTEWIGAQFAATLEQAA